jgi:hypothetical protein
MSKGFWKRGKPIDVQDGTGKHATVSLDFKTGNEQMSGCRRVFGAGWKILVFGLINFVPLKTYDI